MRAQSDEDEGFPNWTHCLLFAFFRERWFFHWKIFLFRTWCWTWNFWDLKIWALFDSIIRFRIYVCYTRHEYERLKLNDYEIQQRNGKATNAKRSCAFIFTSNAFARQADTMHFFHPAQRHMEADIPPTNYRNACHGICWARQSLDQLRVIRMSLFVVETNTFRAIIKWSIFKHSRTWVLNTSSKAPKCNKQTSSNANYKKGSGLPNKKTLAYIQEYKI